MKYLLSRGLAPEIAEYLTSEEANKSKFIPFAVNREDYAIHHFLDGSHRSGYGVKKTNDQLKTDETDYVAVALVEGDDVICINVQDGSVHLWLIQSGDGEMIKVTDSFSDFLSISTEQLAV